MSQLPPIDYASASDDIRQAHDEEVRLRGRMTNMKRILLHSPSAHRIYAEWFTLRAELNPALSDRAIWIFCLSVSRAMKSPVPIGFFRRALIEKGFDPEQMTLTSEEELLQRFGSALAVDSKAVPKAIWRELKSRYPIKVLVDLVAFAGIMVATAVFNNVVEVDLDPELHAYAEI